MGFFVIWVYCTRPCYLKMKVMWVKKNERSCAIIIPRWHSVYSFISEQKTCSLSTNKRLSIRTRYKVSFLWGYLFVSKMKGMFVISSCWYLVDQGLSNVRRNNFQIFRQYIEWRTLCCVVNLAFTEGMLSAW